MSNRTPHPLTPTPAEPSPKETRRTFSAEYKRRILREADACRRPGEVGALLQREGLYTSHLSMWRRAREAGELAGETRPRGPKPKVVDARDARIPALEKENLRLQRLTERAEQIAEVQRANRDALGGPGVAAGRRDRVAAVEAAAAEVGVSAACAAFGMSRATLYRWRAPKYGPRAPAKQPRALRPEARAAVLAVLQEERFAEMSPAKVHATLVEEGRSLCSLSTIQRILRENPEVRERRDRIRRGE